MKSKENTVHEDAQVNAAIACFCWDENGNFCGITEAFPDPMAPGEYLLPANSTNIAPPEPHKNKITKWTGDKWMQELVKAVPVDPEALANEVKSKRNRLLSASDWTQLSDVVLNAAAKIEWKEYRHSLREITKQKGFPASVSWPKIPA